MKNKKRLDRIRDKSADIIGTIALLVVIYSIGAMIWRFKILDIPLINLKLLATAIVVFIVAIIFDTDGTIS